MARDDALQHDRPCSKAPGDTALSAPGFAPPASEEEAIDWLQLIRSPRVGPTTFLKLMRTHKSARAALDALPARAQEAGVKAYVPADRRLAVQEYRAGQAAGAQLIALGSNRYSPLLSQIDGPPPLLWCLGDVGLLNRDCVAMAGARNASSLGMRLTRALSKGLAAEGFVVVSGLARGIDRSAHEAALDTGTIGVLAGGVDVLYPRENSDIYKRMRETGLLVSEQPPGLQPQARHFPRRNRIIAGLASGLVIPEAAVKSGSLITAQDAAAQGREVMAVPGHPFDARAAGCNQLLRDGATLVRNTTDILDALTPIDHAPEAPARPGPTAAVCLHQISEAQVRSRILAHLNVSPLPEDQLIRDLQLPAAVVTSALVELEMTGQILRQPGGGLSLSG